MSKNLADVICTWSRWRGEVEGKGSEGALSLSLRCPLGESWRSDERAHARTTADRQTTQTAVAGCNLAGHIVRAHAAHRDLHSAIAAMQPRK